MHEQSKGLDKARTDYNAYLRHVWPEHIPFTEGRHLKIMGDVFNDIMSGKLKRVIINMPPRHSKSQNASIYFPAFYLGKYPYKQIIQASNVSDLAVGFGRQVRDLVREPAYQELFPGLQIKADSSAAGRWDTNKGGKYYAVGAEGNITGRGGHLVIVDDAHSDEQIKLGVTNPAIYDSTFNWYVGTLRQRLMPGGAILIVQSRFHKRDLTGRILEHAKQNGTLHEWKIIEFPVVMPSGKLLWPEFWTPEEVESLKADMPPSRFASQYMQALAVDTPIPTTRGMVKISDINIGDYVFGSDGKPTKVIWKSDVYRNRPCYKVETDDGASVICDEDHLWTCQIKRANGPFETVNTKFLYERQELRKITHPKAPRRPRIKDQPPIVLPELEYPLDPWALGAWLGDGCVGTTIMACHDDDAPYTRSQFEACGFTTKKYTKKQTFGVTGGFRKAIRDVGVFENKDIPEEYLWGSYDQRMALLQGLVDIDGSAQYGCCQFATTRKSWADKVCRLVSSLGGKPFVHRFVTKPRTINGNKTNKSTLCYKVLFYLDGAARMPRKAELLRNRKTKHGRFLTISETSSVDTQCIRVENEDGLFLAGNGFMLTHNCPSDAEGAIVKKESWRAWDQKLPDFEFKIQSWDTAFSAKDSANYSACTTWGVFKHNNSRDGKPELHAMLIHAYRERMEFTRLKKLAKEFYIDHRPDSIIVEEKATGRPLIFELQQMNIPVASYTPTKGNDKVVRVNSVSDLFSSGKIWYVPNNQTETVIDEFTDFPSGAYDDFVDSGTQALMRFRQGLFIHTDNDETDDEDDFEYNNRSYGYY